jgi:hypothetical protein
MTQVEEALTDTTMENPPRFLDFVRKQTWDWSHGEPVFSSETNPTIGGSRVLELPTFPDKIHVATWEAVINVVFSVHNNQCIFGVTNPTIGSSEVSVAAIEAWLPCPYGYSYSRVSHGNVPAIIVKREHPIVLDLYDLLKDDIYSEDEGQLPAKRNSILHAVSFAKIILVKVKKSPVIDLHPDGEVSLTWRSKRGILNIAFREDGVATYAAYLALTEETHKGRFRVSAVLPVNMINIIEQIEDPNDRQF